MNNLKKLNICIKEASRYPIENEKDPLYKMISNFTEINDIYQNNMKNGIKKFLFFGREKIHKIFYDEDKILNIDSSEINLLSKSKYNNIEINLSELFYFCLLIEDNTNIINYSFSFEYIKFIDNFINNNFNDIKDFNILILSKIILTLIYNFKGEDVYDKNEYKKEIENIENNYNSIINNYLGIFKDYNLNYTFVDFKSKKIDIIYMEIIIALIKLNQFDDYNFYYNKIKELNLKYININKTIFNGLSKELDIEKNNFLKDYIINNADDFLKNQKLINFFYILFKYILKNSIFIYQNKFLKENRKNLLNSLHSILDEIGKLNISSENQEKLKFLIRIMTDYYFCENEFSETIKSLNKELKDNVPLSNTISQNKSNANNSKNNESMSNIFNTAHNSDKSIENTDSMFENNISQSQNKKMNLAEKILTKLILEIQIVPKKDEGSDFYYLKSFYGYEKECLESYLNEDKIEEKLNEFHKILYTKFNYDNIDEKNVNYKKEKKIYKNYQKFLNFLNEVEEYIKSADIKFNPRIKLELEKIKDNDTKETNEGIYNITCISSCEKIKNNDKVLKFKDENILVNGIDGKGQGFIILINELTNDDYKGETITYIDEDNISLHF